MCGTSVVWYRMQMQYWFAASAADRVRFAVHTRSDSRAARNGTSFDGLPAFIAVLTVDNLICPSPSRHDVVSLSLLCTRFHHSSTVATVLQLFVVCSGCSFFPKQLFFCVVTIWKVQFLRKGRWVSKREREAFHIPKVDTHVAHIIVYSTHKQTNRTLAFASFIGIRFIELSTVLQC